MRELYAILELRRGASAREVKRAYYALAHRYHPDTRAAAAGGPSDGALVPAAELATARFREAAFAYEVLGDPTLRNMYDRFGMLGVHAARGTAPRGPEDLGPRAEKLLRFVQRFARRARERLEAVQRERGAARRRVHARAHGRAPGDDVEATAEVAIEDLVHGGRCEVVVPQLTPCPPCAGTGWASGRPPAGCPGCGGEGALSMRVGGMQLRPTCPYCAGGGVTPAADCARCAGRGSEVGAARRTLVVPARHDPTAPLRVAHGGLSGHHAGPRGTLWVRLVVRPQPGLRAEGCDVHLRALLREEDADAGARVSVSWAGGTTCVVVPRGGAHDIARTVRVANAGLWRGDGSRGTLAVLLSCVEVEI